MGTTPGCGQGIVLCAGKGSTGDLEKGALTPSNSQRSPSGLWHSSSEPDWSRNSQPIKMFSQAAVTLANTSFPFSHTQSKGADLSSKHVATETVHQPDHERQTYRRCTCSLATDFYFLNYLENCCREWKTELSTLLATYFILIKPHFGNSISLQLYTLSIYRNQTSLPRHPC